MRLRGDKDEKRKSSKREKRENMIINAKKRKQNIMNLENNTKYDK